MAVSERAIQHIFFESVIHQWLASKVPSPIKTVCWSHSTRCERVPEPACRNAHWIPYSNNFSAIDSAIVIGKTLYVLKITVCSDNPFPFETFQSTFVHPVMVMFSNVSSVRIHLVVPSETDFDFSSCPISLALQGRSEPRPRFGKSTKTDAPEVCYKCSLNLVDMTNMHTIETSLRALPFLTPADSCARLRELMAVVLLSRFRT
jgi:hypothetical protein